MVSPSFLDIGIDGIGLYAPRDRLRVQDLAEARNIDPEKFHEGLLLKEFAVPDIGEDSVSMAIMAANNALWRSGIDPSQIDCVLAGTETSVYAVKSIAAILAGTLGIAENTFTGDLSHACASATCSVINAIGLISAGLVERALVVGTDISKYPLNSPGEPTQGAGAVALIISKKPRIAKFAAQFGKISGHVNDFYRPHGQDTAIVNGHYSVDAYLSFQQHAYEDLTKRTGSISPDYWIFHSPYAKLPVQFFRQLMCHRWLNSPPISGSNQQLGDSIQALTDMATILQGKGEIPLPFIEQFKNNWWNETELLALDQWIRREYAQRLQPSLAVSQHFGNIYSASVWAQIGWVLEKFAQTGDILYFGSYGSGATAIAGLLQVQPEFKHVLSQSPRIEDAFIKKQYIPIVEYERRHQPVSPMTQSIWIGSIIPATNLSDYHQTPQPSVQLAFCDAGCVLPHNKDLSYCPLGHFGRYKRQFPQIAKLVDVREYGFGDPLWEIAHTGFVPIIGRPQVGDLLELNFRRLREDDNKLLQWAPVYSPVAPRLVIGESALANPRIVEISATPHSEWKK